MDMLLSNLALWEGFVLASLNRLETHLRGVQMLMTVSGVWREAWLFQPAFYGCLKEVQVILNCWRVEWLKVGVDTRGVAKYSWGSYLYIVLICIPWAVSKPLKVLDQEMMDQIYVFRNMIIWEGDYGCIGSRGRPMWSLKVFVPSVHAGRQCRLTIMREGAGTSLPGFKAWLNHLLAVKFWASYLTSRYALVFSPEKWR